MALALQQIAPDFTLPSSSGKDFNLRKDAGGQGCIIYFYPKDFTPGCTQEACSFRDSHHLLAGFDIPVYGISKDSVATHQRFIREHQLPFELLADESGAVCKLYKALIPILQVPKRITYLLDKDHKIVGVYDSMFDSMGHIRAMIKKIKAGQSTT
jgi:peroxiredoxin Q/BCP